MRSVLTSSCPAHYRTPGGGWISRYWSRITGRRSAHWCRGGGCVEAASPPCSSPSWPAAAAAGGGAGAGCAACRGAAPPAAGAAAGAPWS